MARRLEREGMYVYLLPGGSDGKESARNVGFNPCVGTIPWKRAWQPTAVFLPGESQGQRSLVGHSPLGGKESDTNEGLSHTQLIHVIVPERLT